jgi:hypothetical protein
MPRSSIVFATLFASTALAQDTGTAVPDNPGFITLLADLDPSVEGDYCWDAVGGSADSGDWMQAHSCHNRMGPMSDQELTTDYPEVGNIYFTLADLCVAARRVVAGAQIYVAECSTSTTQSWISSSDGQVHPADDTSLCVTIARGRPDGVSLYNRGLTLQPCADYPLRQTAWSIPGGSVGI